MVITSFKIKLKMGVRVQIDGFAQERRTSSVLAMELRTSRANSLKCKWNVSLSIAQQSIRRYLIHGKFIVIFNNSISLYLDECVFKKYLT